MLYSPLMPLPSSQMHSFPSPALCSGSNVADLHAYLLGSRLLASTWVWPAPACLHLSPGSKETILFRPRGGYSFLLLLISGALVSYGGFQSNIHISVSGPFIKICLESRLSVFSLSCWETVKECDWTQVKST